VRSLRSPHIDNRRHARSAHSEHERRQEQSKHQREQPARHRFAGGADRAEPLELRRLQQHGLPIRLRDRGVLDAGQPPVDQVLLDLFDDLRDVEDDLTVLECQRSASRSLEEPLECLLGPGAQSGPDVREGLGREELLDLSLHGTTDCRRQGSDRAAAAVRRGSPRRNGIEEPLDVDLLLDGIRHLVREGGLDLG
jgi:hypothetical protein